MQNLSRYASHSCIIRHILRHNSVCSYCYIINSNQQLNCCDL